MPSRYDLLWPTELGMSAPRKDAATTAETIARQSYGKLVAILASRSGDLAGAKDALADAFASALVDWARNGLPKRPETWH